MKLRSLECVEKDATIEGLENENYILNEANLGKLKLTNLTQTRAKMILELARLIIRIKVNLQMISKSSKRKLTVVDITRMLLKSV